MSAIVEHAAEAAKEAPMHIDVQDLTFGYAGREVTNSPFSSHVTNKNTALRFKD
jgi:hypothetical protein